MDFYWFLVYLMGGGLAIAFALMLAFGVLEVLQYWVARKMRKALIDNKCPLPSAWPLQGMSDAVLPRRRRNKTRLAIVLYHEAFLEAGLDDKYPELALRAKRLERTFQLMRIIFSCYMLVLVLFGGFCMLYFEA